MVFVCVCECACVHKLAYFLITSSMSCHVTSKTTWGNLEADIQFSSGNKYKREEVCWLLEAEAGELEGRRRRLKVFFGCTRLGEESEGGYLRGDGEGALLAICLPPPALLSLDTQLLVCGTLGVGIGSHDVNWRGVHCWCFYGTNLFLHCYIHVNINTAFV